MKVCLVNDTSNTCNWGSRATSTALRLMLEDAGARVDSVLYESRLTEMQRLDHPTLLRSSCWIQDKLPDTRLSHRVSRGVFNRIARRWPEVVPRSWDEFPRLERRVLEGHAMTDIRACLEACDLVVISGEGCLYGNIRQSRMLLFIAYLARHGLGRETVLVNHSVDFRHPVLAEMARHVYPILDEVVFRENSSAETCAEFCEPVIGADAAYWLMPATGHEWLNVTGRTGYFDGWPSRARWFNPREPYICVGGSSSFLRPETRGQDPLQGYLALCRELMDAFGQILLVSASWQDERILSKVSDQLGLPLLGVSTPFPQAMDAVANAWAYVGGRWHTAIFAHAGATPVVALGAYTSKMQAFLHHIGQPGEPLDPFRLDAEAAHVRECLEEIRSQGEELGSALRESVAQFRRQSRLNVRYVESSLSPRLASATTDSAPRPSPI